MIGRWFFCVCVSVKTPHHANDCLALNARPKNMKQHLNLEIRLDVIRHKHVYIWRYMTCCVSAQFFSFLNYSLLFLILLSYFEY